MERERSRVKPYFLGQSGTEEGAHKSRELSRSPVLSKYVLWAHVFGGEATAENLRPGHIAAAASCII